MATSVLGYKICQPSNVPHQTNIRVAIPFPEPIVGLDQCIPLGATHTQALTFITWGIISFPFLSLQTIMDRSHMEAPWGTHFPWAMWESDARKANAWSGRPERLCLVRRRQGDDPSTHGLSQREEGALRREMGLLSAPLSWSLRYFVPWTL